MTNFSSNTVSQYTIGADGALAPLSPASAPSPFPWVIVTSRP
jgi:hypothetical protein